MILTEGGFKIIRDHFGPLNQSQVNGFNFLVKKMTDAVFSYPEAAYALATVWWETAHTMQPIKERGSDTYLKSKKYYPYIGYGYVQLTWKANYEMFSKILGIDLVAHPELALEPAVAARIMTHGMLNGSFTGVGFRRKRPVKRYDRQAYIKARAIINGTDRAVEIADIAMVMEKALRAA